MKREKQTMARRNNRESKFFNIQAKNKNEQTKQEITEERDTQRK